MSGNRTTTVNHSKLTKDTHKFMKLTSWGTLRLFPVWIVLAFIFAVTNLPSVAAQDNPAGLKFNQILKKKSLRVGVSFFTPWTLKNKKGELVGFEIDVAKKLAEDMGVVLKIIPLDWEQLIPSLNSGKIDLISAGMAITPQRALKVNFSSPYATSGISLATNTALTKHIQSLKELNQSSIRIGVISTTVSEDLAKRLFDKAFIRVFQKNKEAEEAILNGDIHAYLEAEPIPQFLALAHPKKIDLPLSEPLLRTNAGFAVRKGDPDFLNFLNSWIVARKADTWLGATHQYWFESLKWK